MVIYCRSLSTVADIYAHFLCTLGNNSYHPLGSERISDNRLYHANILQYNKDLIQRSMQDRGGVVHIVFASVALDMGVNMMGVNMALWGSSFTRGLHTGEWPWQSNRRASQVHCFLKAC